jgi:foldase protein PrsA
LLVALVALVAGLVLSGCGSGERPLPPGAVARVDGALIGDATVGRLTGALAASSHAQRGGEVLDPPQFAGCVAQSTRQLARLGRPGAGVPGAAALRARCQAQEVALRAQVAQSLISASWIASEAHRRKISVSTADVESQLAGAQRARGGLGSLLSAGLSLDDARFLVRTSMLLAKLRTNALSHLPAISDAQVARYFAANRRLLGTPARRDVVLVLTRDLGQVRRASRALQRGARFAAVARRFSIDPVTRRRGGRSVFGQTPQPSPLEQAVFSAPKGRLVGPVKTSMGFYLFRVTRAVAGRNPSLSAVKGKIRDLLRRQQQAQALRQLAERMQRTWAPRTACARPLQTQVCSRLLAQSGSRQG